MSRTRNPNPCLLLLLALFSWTTVECACPVPSSKPQQLVLVNGQVRVSSSYKDGASLQLSCPLGHTLNVTKGDSNYDSGSHINSVCSSNGRWDPYWPKCMVTKCGYLTVTNGNWRPKRLKAGSVTTVTCDAGYVLSQSGSISAKLLCNIDGQWNQTTPSCVKVPPASGCRSPAVIEGLQLRDSYVLQSVFALGSTVSYRCSLGYMRMGGQTAAQCTERGWTRPTLRCELKSCGSAGEIRNGQYVYDEGVLFGSRARAVCNQGHHLIGEGTRVCLNEGWDGREAVCEAVQCPPPPQVFGAEQLGSLEEPYLYQQVIGYRCRAGQLVGAREMHCTQNGTWSDNPPRCTVPPASGCRSPAVIEGLQLRDSYVLQSVFALGSTVSYRCSLGYMRMGGQTAAQCTERGWTRPTLRCERKSCGSAGEIRNGQYVYDEGVLFGSRARAVCNQGHYLIGEGTRVCLNEGWDGREAVCEAVQCPPPPQVLGAEQLGSLEEPYLYQQVIGYRCRAGQLVGAREMHCTQNGTWSDNPPRCTELACRQPVVRFALWSWNKLHYRPGEWVGVSCQQGRRLQGPARLTCGADGQWEPAVPTCVPTWGSK
ncbi:complement receptor type 1-like [Engraulis encrasicolus]|uniref:complement receptor type 1-like n=1 Tax=Engraulis encrasicolus TaxID=184585 RepID=UPI002FCE87D7